MSLRFILITAWISRRSRALSQGRSQDSQILQEAAELIALVGPEQLRQLGFGLRVRKKVTQAFGQDRDGAAATVFEDEEVGIGQA